MPTKKNSKKPTINIQRIAEQRLLDSKIVPDRDDRIAYLVTIAIAAGILVGLAVLAYLYFSQNPVIPQSGVHQIIVPETPTASSSTIPIIQPTATTTAPQTPSPTSTSAIAAPGPMVTIRATPTGYLNVRQGPGANTAKIAQVKPGDTFALISEVTDNGGWYQIKLDQRQSGWIAKKYASLK